MHPSLLPAFPGLDAARQAFEHGVQVTGATVHLVDEGLDSGPIVLQEAVAVKGDDTPETLAARILEAEHRIYPRAVRLMLDGGLRRRGPPRAQRAFGMSTAFDLLAKGCVDVVTRGRAPGRSSPAASRSRSRSASIPPRPTSTSATPSSCGR